MSWYELSCENHGAATTCVICLSLFEDSDSLGSGDIIGYAVGMTLLCSILITKLFVPPWGGAVEELSCPHV